MSASEVRRIAVSCAVAASVVLLGTYALAGTTRATTAGVRGAAPAPGAPVAPASSGRDGMRYARPAQASRADGCKNDWTIEVVDGIGDVGAASSLALEATSPFTPHVSYREDVPSSHRNVKYAKRRAAGWTNEIVDEGGDRTDVALAPTAPFTPCVVYDDISRPDFWTWRLSYACRAGAGWTRTVLSRTRTVLSRLERGQQPSLALEPVYPHVPHVTYYNPSGVVDTLIHASLEPSGWMTGTWGYDTVEPSLSRVGWWPSIDLAPADPFAPRISYYDQGGQDLKYAWLEPTGWLTVTVDSGGDVGPYSSLASDRDGTPHISYVDMTRGLLKFATRTASAWTTSTITSVGQPPWGGGATSLALDSTGTPQVAFYDARTQSLGLAVYDGGDWRVETVDDAGDVGQFSSLALDAAGCPHISYYDATNGDLKYAYRAAIATPSATPTASAAATSPSPPSPSPTPTALATATFSHRIALPIAHVERISWAENRSTTTTCSEEDNVNIPLFGPQVTRFDIVASHPRHPFTDADCPTDFTDCPRPTPGPTPRPDRCVKVYDDHRSELFEGCAVDGFWRPRQMHFTSSQESGDFDYVRWSRNIPGTTEWPQVLVLYSDGYARLVPHPPIGFKKTCFGSSVLVGRAPVSARPFADVSSAHFTTANGTLSLSYENGDAAEITLDVDRAVAKATVRFSYAGTVTETLPFATFRSMFVADGTADADTIANPVTERPILGPWKVLAGDWWLLSRRMSSTHNTSAPDIRINVLR